MELHQSPSQYMFYLLCTFEIISPNLPCFLETHPNRDMYDFVTCLDNDMILIEDGWDLIIQEAMELAEKQVPSIKLIGQYVGGCSGRDEVIKLRGKETKVRVGVNSGSGLWNFRPLSKVQF